MAQNTTERKSVQEMVGEFLREASVLVLVFGFLDAFVKEQGASAEYWLGVVMVSGFALLSGILAERTRQ